MKLLGDLEIKTIIEEQLWALKIQTEKGLNPKANTEAMIKLLNFTKETFGIGPSKEVKIRVVEGEKPSKEFITFLKKVPKKRKEKQCVSEFEVKALGMELIDILYDLLPKQADEVIRAIKANIPIMLIDNLDDDTKANLQTALRNAGAVIVPPCITDYKKENVCFLTIFLNIKETPTAVTDGVSELSEERELIEKREEIEYRNAVIAVVISVVSIIISIAALIIRFVLH